MARLVRKLAYLLGFRNQDLARVKEGSPATILRHSIVIPDVQPLPSWEIQWIACQSKHYESLEVL